MDNRQVLEAYAAGEAVPDDHPMLSEESQALYVDRWWPAAMRLNSNVHLVRRYDDGPHPEISDELCEVLAASGLHHLAQDWPLIESISLQRLGVLGGRWETWAQDAQQAEAAINRAAMDVDSAPEL